MASTSKQHNRFYLAVELGLLYIGLPVLLYSQRHILDEYLIPILMLLATGCIGVLWWDRHFECKRLWNPEAFFRHAGRTFQRFVPGAVIVGGLLALLRPDLLLSLPRSYPDVWIVIMVTYPVLSVYPQEIIFRAFFFHRYDALFPSEWGKVTASGVVFGIAHIIFANWVAPVMTAGMGVLFGVTYARSRSTLQATLEHGLWGCYAFTVGIGWYVYSGSL